MAATDEDLAAQMVRLVDAVRARQEGDRAHGRVVLIGPDPGDGQRLRHEPVGWWFAQPAPALLRALRHPDSGWVVPGSAASSRLVTELLASGNAMARALQEVRPRTGGPDGMQVVRSWIDAGCPVPEDPGSG